MKAQLVNAAVIAGLMVAAAFALPWLNRLGVIPGDKAEMSQRAFSVMLGLLMVGRADIAPKRLKPLSQTRCDPAREQASRRFSSLVIVAGGLLYCAAWVAAPFALALPLSVAALAGALMIVLAQCLILKGRP